MVIQEPTVPEVLSSDGEEESEQELTIDDDVIPQQNSADFTDIKEAQDNVEVSLRLREPLLRNFKKK